MTDQTQRPIKHYTAGAIVLTDTKPQKVLLVHHKKTGMWLQPGGHLEAGENPYEAALREVKEETGLDISPYLTKPTVIYEQASYLPVPVYLLEEKIPAHGDEPEHFHLDQMYVVTLPEQTVIHQAEESHGIGWFTLEEIQNLPTFENMRAVLRQEMQS